jgi:uncharacterized damage-inducible protein DinB
VYHVNELQRIRDQIIRSLDGEAWHGPALTEVLAGVDARAAMARPIPNAHTIWEILLHLSASAELVLSRLRGEARTLSPEEDWPVPLPAGDVDDWEADVRRVAQVHRELIEELSTLDESRLDAPIVPGFSSAYVTLHGLVQHNVYHAGQIALIKKAL